MAIKKPSCVHSVNSAKKTENHSIAEILIKNNPKAKLVSIKPEDGGLVNRLDYETSGIILAAKDRKTWGLMREKFKKSEIKKTYLAVMEGKVPESIKVENYIGSGGRNSKKVKVFSYKPPLKYRASAAATFFKRLKYNKENNTSLVEARIITGVRHQIRAHAKFIKHPLAGDKLYGSVFDSTDVFFLHSSGLEFLHPCTGEKLIIKSSPEKDFGAFGLQDIFSK